MQDFEVIHPKIYIIYELLKHIKWLVTLIQSSRIPMTPGDRIASSSPGEDPILVVSQKPETSDPTHCNELFHVKMCG